MTRGCKLEILENPRNKSGALIFSDDSDTHTQTGSQRPQTD